MKYKLLMIFSIMYSLTTSAQKHDYHWIFGTDHDYNTEEWERSWSINRLDFSGSPNEFGTSIERQFFIGQTEAGICDDDGNFLFFTNGCMIWNQDLDTMQNGLELNPGLGYTNNCAMTWGYDIHQGAMILPKPEDESKYYLFTQKKDEWITENHVVDRGVDALLYTIVDMNKAGALGAVVEKNVPVISGNKLDQGFLTGVKHSNNKDWWVLVSAKDEGIFYSALLTSSGVQPYETQQIGDALCPLALGTGQASFSPDGTKYARFTPQCGLQLYDFDRSTGLLSNPQHLDNPNNAIELFGGLAFSPSGQFLYFSHWDKIFQIDLEAPDLEASLEIVATWDGTLFNDYFPTTFHLMQLGPDCRIHVNMPGYGKYWHIIEHPNEKGLECDVTQNIELPNIYRGNMPLFPNYRLGTGAVCDSTLLTSSTYPFILQSNIKVYPNPVIDILNIELPDYLNKEVVNLRLTDSSGKIIKEISSSKGESILSISTVNINSGIYFLEISTNDWTKTEKVVVF